MKISERVPENWILELINPSNPLERPVSMREEAARMEGEIEMLQNTNRSKDAQIARLLGQNEAVATCLASAMLEIKQASANID